MSERAATRSSSRPVSSSPPSSSQASDPPRDHAEVGRLELNFKANTSTHTLLLAALGAQGSSKKPKVRHDDHSGKRFQCSKCSWNFTTPEHLARHARKHSGERPFPCRYQGCGKSFTRRDNMLQHYHCHFERGMRGKKRRIREAITSLAMDPSPDADAEDQEDGCEGPAPSKINQLLEFKQFLDQQQTRRKEVGLFLTKVTSIPQKKRGRKSRAELLETPEVPHAHAHAHEDMDEDMDLEDEEDEDEEEPQDTRECSSDDCGDEIISGSPSPQPTREQQQQQLQLQLQQQQQQRAPLEGLVRPQAVHPAPFRLPPLSATLRNLPALPFSLFPTGAIGASTTRSAIDTECLNKLKNSLKSV